MDSRSTPDARPVSPFAVALGNASLLGVGYLLLRRRALAAANLLITLVLVLLATVILPLALQVVVVAFWLTVIGHGWWLARGRAVPLGSRPQWLIAAAAAVPVLLVVTLVRVDGLLTGNDAIEAHADGDCATALGHLDGLGYAHRLVDPVLMSDADEQRAACLLLRRAETWAGADAVQAAGLFQRYRGMSGAYWAGAGDRRAELLLDQVEHDFAEVLKGDVASVFSAFRLLDSVRREPGREAAAGDVLVQFLDDLRQAAPCNQVKATDALAGFPTGRGELDRAVDVVPSVEPLALVRCGDALLDDHRAKDARTKFRLALRRYPDSEVSRRAERGLNRASTAIELARLRRALKPSYPGAVPSYCANPVSYRGAEPYRGRGPHRVVLFGESQHRTALPSSWRAKDPADAVLVICTGETKYGTAQQTCPYESEIAIGGAQPVTFHKKKFSVRVYEVRTGRRVSGFDTVQIDGASCPQRLYYESFVEPLGPPSQVYVKSSDADVRAAFKPIVRP